MYRLITPANCRQRKSWNNKAQAMLEYGFLIAVVVGAFVAMQFYVKRGLQGRYRESADEIGEQYSASETTSYISQSFSSQVTVNADPQVIEITDPDSTTENRTFLFVNRAVTQTATNVVGSWEETGKFENDLFK